MVFAVVLVAGGIALGLIAFFFVTFAPPKRTAPGPLMLPFLGTALSGIYQLSFKDYKIMPALAKKYGKVFQLCYPVNMQPVYVIADSALAREVLTRKDDFHGKNPQNRASNLMTPNGLLGLLDNDMMKNHRRIMTTALFNREYLESYISTMNQKADVMIEVLNPHAGTGKPLDIKDKFTKATLDVILKLAFGYEGNSQKSDAKMFTGNPRFGLALFMRMVCPDWLYRLTPFKKIFDDTLTALHALANGVIRAEIEAPGKPRSRVGSILEALMFASSIEEKDEDGNVGAKMSVDEFKDEAVTILFAGHDTTAGTLGWVSYMLAKPENKHVVQKLREEIKQVLGDREYVSYEDLNKLVYCEAVFMETFRFFPTVPLVTRNCPKGAEIGGFHFEAGVSSRKEFLV
eukprot:TRINITY_DN6885_c0_g1_i1.p1 TRINITY_DN6885_c0_g1~~TRINITY_DN6885_c0_g1_i1.p1  ORF type:complete len:402 (+),score=116.99 TRINITY_DN6885_c0_g1_i1:39-1244(+)